MHVFVKHALMPLYKHNTTSAMMWEFFFYAFRRCRYT